MTDKVMPLESHKVLRKLISDYWGEVKQAKENGKLVAWSTGLSPTDLFETMDFVMVFPENYAATCG